MGIYGSDGVVKTISSMARERQERSDRRAARMEAWDQRLHERYGHRTQQAVPSEELACPLCFTHYAFGDNCPDCGSALTGVSVLEAERSEVALRPSLANTPALGVLLTALGCLAFLVLVLVVFGGDLNPLMSRLMY